MIQANIPKSSVVKKVDKKPVVQSASPSVSKAVSNKGQILKKLANDKLKVDKALDPKLKEAKVNSKSLFNKNSLKSAAGYLAVASSASVVTIATKGFGLIGSHEKGILDLSRIKYPKVPPPAALDLSGISSTREKIDSMLTYFRARFFCKDADQKVNMQKLLDCIAEGRRDEFEGIINFEALGDGPRMWWAPEGMMGHVYAYHSLSDGKNTDSYASTDDLIRLLGKFPDLKIYEVGDILRKDIADCGMAYNDALCNCSSKDEIEEKRRALYISILRLYMSVSGVSGVQKMALRNVGIKSLRYLNIKVENGNLLMDKSGDISGTVEKQGSSRGLLGCFSRSAEWLCNTFGVKEGRFLDVYEQVVEAVNKDEMGRVLINVFGKTDNKKVANIIAESLRNGNVVDQIKLLYGETVSRN